MKYVIIFFTLIFWGCKSDQSVDPATDFNTLKSGFTNTILGKWKLYSYEDKKEIAYDVWLELKAEKNEKGMNKLNGKSAVNFFQAGFKADANDKSFKVSDLMITEIAGTKQELDFETNFLKRLMETQLYEINTKGELILKITANSKQSLIFKQTN